MFMAVPTIYFKMIAYWETLVKEKQEALYHAMSKFRLMVCGSAALPVSIMEKWKLISGHTLLERYGMTEIGMGISNPYHGERRAGFVGKPLPGVSVRLGRRPKTPRQSRPSRETKWPASFRNIFREPRAKPIN